MLAGHENATAGMMSTMSNAHAHLISRNRTAMQRDTFSSALLAHAHILAHTSVSAGVHQRPEP